MNIDEKALLEFHEKLKDGRRSCSDVAMVLRECLSDLNRQITELQGLMAENLRTALNELKTRPGGAEMMEHLRKPNFETKKTDTTDTPDQTEGSL